MDPNFSYAVLGIAATLLIASIFFLWQVKQERLANEIMLKRDHDLRELTSRQYNEPRDINADRDLIQVASKYEGITEVRVMGINSLGVIHQAREDIIKLLKAGKSIKFLLLNPLSDEFNNRINDFECVYDGVKRDFQKHRHRLIAEWNSSVMILRSILSDINRDVSLEIRVRKEKPEFAMSATIGKNELDCFSLINEYPSEGRGTRGKQYLSRKYIPSEKRTYEEFLVNFEESWNNAEPISIADNKWIL